MKKCRWNSWKQNGHSVLLEKFDYFLNFHLHSYFNLNTIFGVKKKYKNVPNKNLKNLNFVSNGMDKKEEEM